MSMVCISIPFNSNKHKKEIISDLSIELGKKLKGVITDKESRCIIYQFRDTSKDIYI